jgi:hypothetical protein
MSGARGLLSNPFIEEGARIYFSHRAILRTYAVLLAVLAGMLVFWWPRGAVAGSLPPADGPRTLAVVAVGLFVAVAWLSARYGAEDYSSSSFIRMTEDVALTPLPLASVIGGKLSFALLHTLFLLALGAPFLLAALGVSGVPPGAAFRILLVVGSSAVACRALGLFLLTVLGEHALIRDLVMLSAGCVSIPASMAAFPPANPVSAILSLSGAANLPPTVGMLGADLPFYLFSVIVSLLGAAVFASAAAVRLAIMRGRRGAA